MLFTNIEGEEAACQPVQNSRIKEPGYRYIWHNIFVGDYMAQVTVYTVPNCLDCAAVKNLLDSAKIAYKEIDISNIPDAREALAMLSGVSSMPQVFIGSRFIGQVPEIRYLIQTGQLERLRPCRNSGE